MSLLNQLPLPPPGRIGWPWTEETPPASYAGRTYWPRISIVTPSYQQGDYLEETIRSILLQNYPNLQYLVVDGGSTDGSREIIARYAPWLNHWESERDRGQSHAINKGLARCDGDWFNWINSDDCLLPGALATIGVADPARLIFSAGELTGPTLAEARPLGCTKTGPTVEEALVNHYICQQGLFLRTSAVQQLGGVREELHYVMDLDLFARVLLRGGRASVQESSAPVAFFRQHAAAKTATSAGKFFAEEERVAAGLARAAGLGERILRHLPADGSLLYVPVAAPLDPVRLEELLARKYWWNGTVEGAWRRHEYTGFKREVRAFRQAHPGLQGTRISKLHFMALLPEPFLRLLSFLRAASR
ncbi:Putative teichuronic acid biosynthesis glycosyltransferase TuaG [Lacunisphaera limnophila]|uniref:Teichuronic acid biosynthesis glycosyltransferase TuaG n=1 Tax=Lacunisphaera limnophila TaxID=1838286 RepID=A0A1D8AXX1_9BACT|nr:glycosyltransferase family 2 protein [Lacunisphaera limnophila]AOS45746.1 Putative teichuronic acid biosynthesis glycosyltransferase TuaG [Lacunisphaera limnophila]